MKKNRTVFLIFIVLALTALVLWLSQSETTFSRSLQDFAIDDTSTVTKIFMADKNNNTLTLKKMSPGKWIVNDKFPGQKQTIESLLLTMKEIEVQQPVAKAAHDNIIKDLAVNSVKVEIYQQVYRIDLFGKIRWFRHEKLTKVYYVGGATQNNQGSFMLMEDSSEPFVVYLPGFRGFVSPRYSPIEKYWRDYNIFRKTIPEIAGVKVEIPETPAFSFEVKKVGKNKYAMISTSDNLEIRDYDTLKLMNFLSGFRNLSYEALLNDMGKSRKDSILTSRPFVCITLTDTLGKSVSVKTFHKKGPDGQTDPAGNPMPYDLDRLYALVNDGQDFTLIQYYTFDKVLRPKSFFLKEAPGKSNRKKMVENLRP